MIKNNIILVLLAFLSTLNLQAQVDTSPYDWEWNRHGYWLGTALAGTATGFLIIQNKEGASEQTILSLNKEDVFVADRWAAGYFNEDLNKLSDIPFYTSLATPFALMLADNHQTEHAGKISLMYIEAMATTGALFTITAGISRRLRPLTYNQNVSLSERTRSTNTRSFYAGHAAATATATFFAAKVYTDFHPNVNNKWLIWTAAALVPAAVGAMRIRAGKHFLTDTLLGYALGAATGYFIPELHKKENRNLTFAPFIGRDQLGLEQKGVYLAYRF